ncbi:hypothetical protein ES708_28843 [subsurface metagenome]
MGGGDLLSVVGAGVLEGEMDDAAAGHLRDDLQADTRILPDFTVRRLEDQLPQPGRLRLALLELDARVEALGVLPDDDDIDILKNRRRPRIYPAGAQAGVKVQLLTQGDVNAAEPRAYGGGHRPLDGDAVLPDGSQRGFGQ